MGFVFLMATRGVPAAEPASFHNGLSLQGFTGSINTPSAHVTEEGWFYGLYTNQEESKWRNKTPFQDNYLFSVGLFNFIEVGGRFFEAPKAGRDLSANFKLTSAPLFQKYPYVPTLAVGIQDIGGGATFFKTKYAVISEDIWRLRLSAGYGSGPDRMKGLFAGGEFKAHDWVYLLGDYDTKETNLGARVVVPQFWKVPVSFTATAKTSLDHKPGNFDIAVGFSLPLDFKVRKRELDTRDEEGGQAAHLEHRTAIPETAGSPEQRTPNFAVLRDRLVQAGFTNVRVGTSDSGILVVEYENVRFNHNELDGVGVAAGIAVSLAKDNFKSLRLVIKRHDIPMVRLTMPLRTVAGFLQGNVGQQEFNDSLVINFDAGQEDTDFATGTGNPGFLKSSLVLYPGLTTFVGTEVGVFDYLLSIKPDLLVNAWKGAVINARWDIPVSWSDNLEDGKLYSNYRHGARMERLMLFQAFKPFPALMVNLGGGLILPHLYGTLNEATWSPGNGSHRFRALQAYGKDSDTHQTTTSYLGSYRYYFSPLDLYLEGTAGRFWAQDKGFALEMKRFFGDAAVSVYYKDTKGSDHKQWKAAGIQFSFPLTFGKDMKHYYSMQVRGSDEWSYAQETTLKNNNFNNSRGSLNYLAPYPLAINPQPITALYRSYYNRDRLSEAYIRKQLVRVMTAWAIFGKDI